MDWKTFQRYFCDPQAQDCEARISTLLSFTMIRRTMKTSILNRPIITLPTPHPVITYIQFSAAEKIIYRLTENRFRANLNRFFERGDAARNYGVFMVQLLRLRQCTSHPFMLEQTIREAWTLEDVQELKLRLSRINSAELTPFYKQVEVWVGERDENSPILPFGKGDFGHAFSMGPALDMLNEEEMMKRVTCGICSDFPQNAKRTDVSFQSILFSEQSSPILSGFNTNLKAVLSHLLRRMH